MLLLLILISMYFLPTIVAFIKKRRNAAAIAVTNVLLGWTGVGWCVAMIWAACK